MSHTNLADWLSGWWNSRRTNRPVRRQSTSLQLEGLEHRLVPTGFTGGLYLGTGDVNKDGYTDTVVACAAGSNPTVTVVSGQNGQTLQQFFAFDPRFRGGVNVAVGDLTGDGIDDIACAAANGPASVTVWDGSNGALLASISAFGAGVNGASVAIGDFKGDGTLDLAVGSGAGGGGAVTVYQPTVSTTSITLTSIASITAFAGFNGAVKVAMGNVTGNMADELIVAAGPGGAPAVAIFSQAGGSTPIASYYAFDPSFPGGVNISTGFFSNANLEDVVVGMGAGGTPTVALFKGIETTAYTSFLAFSEGYQGGVNVATGGYSASLGLQPPRQQVVVAPAGASEGQTMIYDVARQQFLFTFTSFSTTAVAPTTLFYNPAPSNPYGAVDPVVVNPMTPIVKIQGAANTTTDLATVFADPNASNTFVQLQTSDGTVNLELLDQAAPLTVNNYLSYVNAGSYNGTIWHRSVTDFVVQGGGYKVTGAPPSTTLTHISASPPVVNEFSLLRSNVRSTVAMAKVGSDPNSATSEFFFNVANNSANLDNQNGGFTVFANVVGTGMSRVDPINAGPNYTINTSPGTMDNVPLQGQISGAAPVSPVAVGTTSTANYYTVNTATVLSLGEQLTFTVVSNSNPAVVTPTIVGNGLTLAYSATETGTSVLVLRATDRAGHATDTAVTITVDLPPA